MDFVSSHHSRRYPVRYSLPKMSEKRLDFIEHDEAGNVTATYVSSPENSEGMSRVDVIVCSNDFCARYNT